MHQGSRGGGKEEARRMEEDVRGEFFEGVRLFSLQAIRSCVVGWDGYPSLVYYRFF
jgi:hypothetical protein